MVFLEEAPIPAVTNRAGLHDRPRLAAGIELLGPYKGSGVEDPPYLLRHPDGRIVQVTRLLHLVASFLDGHRGAADVADCVSQRFGRRVSAENVAFLLAQKLAPLGLLAGQPGEGRTPPSPVLSLRLRRRVLPERPMQAATARLQPLFHPLVVTFVLAVLVEFDVWLLTDRRAGAVLRDVAAGPGSVLGLLGLLVASAAFHELGHATACRADGARPGAMGVGLYLVWPAFFTDVTDSYRLGRGGRLRTDLGGVYFNAVFMVAAAAVYGTIGWRVLIAFIVVQHLQVAYQFMPFVRLDGYYVVSDLAGVPDLFNRVRPVLASLVPGRPAPPEVRELKARPRALVTAWVVLALTFLAATLLVLARHGPDVASQVGRSVVLQLTALATAVRHGQPVRAAVAAVGAAVVVLPAVGMLMTLTVVARRIAGSMAQRRRPPSVPAPPATEVQVPAAPAGSARPLPVGPRPAPPKPATALPGRWLTPTWSSVHVARPAAFVGMGGTHHGAEEQAQGRQGQRPAGQ